MVKNKKSQKIKKNNILEKYNIEQLLDSGEYENIKLPEIKNKEIDEDKEIEEILKEAGVSKINIKNENVKIGLDREIDDILSNSGIDVRELENDDENYDYQYTGTGKICKISHKENNPYDVSFEIIDENIISSNEWKEIKEIADEHYEKNVNKNFSKEKISEQKELEIYYNNIKNKVYIGYEKFPGDKNKIIKCDKEYSQLDGYLYYLDMVDNKNNSYYIQMDRYTQYRLLKQLPLTWYIKYYWNKYNPISLYKNYKIKKNYNNDINEMLYIGGCIEENPFKLDNKSSFSDKLKWFGHNLFHCKCSDNIDESCEIDIENIIKNNSFEKIKEIKESEDKLYKLQQEVRSLLEIMDKKEYPEYEEKFLINGKTRTILAYEWIDRLSELNYDYKDEKDLRRFIKNFEYDIDESCEKDIENIIKNNTMEQIEKDKEELLKNPNWDNDNLILYKNERIND